MTGDPSRRATAGRTRRRAVACLCALLLLAGWAVLPRAARAQGALSAIESDVDRIARRARPSLVMVVAQRTVQEKSRSGVLGPPRQHRRAGSGVAVEPNGLLTTASVVLGAERIVVRTANGLQAEATLVGMDPVFNVALLRVPGLELPVVKFADRPPQLGDWVIALGTSYRGQPTQSVGNIEARFEEPRQSLLQLTNGVYPGNSGGAALNSRGELIGIVQGELGSPQAPGRTSEGDRRPSGMSFVLPVDNVRPVYESLAREGRVPHGFFGVSTRAASVESESERGVDIPLGALVENVQAGSPAARLGLVKGDLIVAFDRERVEYPEQLARWVAASRPGRVVELVWVHNEMQRKGTVALGESASAIPSWMQVSPGPLAAGGGGGTSGTRIQDLEQEIRRLSRELARLKSDSDSIR